MRGGPIGLSPPNATVPQQPSIEPPGLLARGLPAIRTAGLSLCTGGGAAKPASCPCPGNASLGRLPKVYRLAQ